jgi:hypothetical protein
MGWTWYCVCFKFQAYLVPQTFTHRGSEMIPPQIQANRQRVVAMNERAMAMMNRGDFCDATRELTLALSTLKQTISPLLRHRRPPRDSVALRASSVSLDQCIFQQYRQTACTTNKNGPGDTDLHYGSEDDSSPSTECTRTTATSSTTTSITPSSCLTKRAFIHHQPIQIPKELNDDEDTSPTSMTLLLIIVLFNLSLSCQLEAVKEVSEKKTTCSSCHCTDPYSSVRHLLIRATRLYEMSLSLLNDLSGATIFRLAVANNLGVLFTQLKQSEKATVCFQRSMSILTLLIEHKMQDQVLHFPGFLSNALLYSCRTTNDNVTGARAA